MSRSAGLPNPFEADGIQPLARQEFEQFRQLAYRTFGLDLRSGKEELVAARLGRLVRAGSFRSYQEYYRHILKDSTGAALALMIDALATNHTSFMREPDHFRFLQKQVLPELAARPAVDIWSAACSTGEEVWTLACILEETLSNRTGRVVATDISNKALKLAEHGVYPKERCQGIPPDWLSRYFVLESSKPPAYSASKRLRVRASFRRINLIKPYSWHRLFPVIFCRNVMIYFDRDTQQTVVSQLERHLEPGGYLFVGHAESLNRISHSLEYVQPAVYRKTGKQEGKWLRSS